MTTERILVIYFESQIDEECWLDDFSSKAAWKRLEQINITPNAFEFEFAEPGKEIYLYDLFPYLPKSQLCNYRVIAYVSAALNKAVHVFSPTSVLPVINVDRNATIILHIYPSISFPVTSSRQSPYFTSLSRQLLYSYDNAKTAEKQSSNRGLEQPRDETRMTSKRGREGHRDNTTEVLASHRNRGMDESVKDAKSVQPLVSEDSVAAIAEAAKETAGAFAKSFLSFASSTIKNVADVTQTAASTFANSSATIVGATRVVIVRELADGGFGKVYLANDSNQPGRQYALKQMHCQSGEQEKDAVRELQALQTFSEHENIIRLIDSGIVSSKHMKTVNFLFPLCSQGTAWDAIVRADPNSAEGLWPFPERRAFAMALGAARALNFIHDKGFTHRDVKPHNILIADDGTPLLTDFGSVAQLVVEVNTRQKALQVEEEAASKTSAPYRSPELTQVIYPCVLDGRVDVWGLGCTLYCLAFGWSPFESKREGVLRLAIINGRFTYPPNLRMKDCSFSSTFKELVDGMLQHSINNRMQCSDVVRKLESILR